MSSRQAGKRFNIAHATLARHVKAHKESGNTEFQYISRLDNQRVFSDDEEVILVRRIQAASQTPHGVTKKRIREMAYDLAQELGKTCPQNWDEERKAGESFMRYFLKRNNL